ncbi:hypothetical protein J6590_093676 [Homalodisca vitripennis]|nr:hypothetical protein J6590_093676 [Homalodisca vitripennis]
MGNEVTSSIHPPISLFRSVSSAAIVSIETGDNSNNITLQTLHNYNSTVPRGIVSSTAIVSIEMGDNSNNYSTDVTQLQFHRTPGYSQLLSALRRKTTATTTLQTLHNYNSTVPRGIVSSAAIVSIEMGDNSNNYSTDVTQLQFHRTPGYSQLLSALRWETPVTTTLQTLHNYNSTVPRRIVSSAAIVSIEMGDNSNNDSTEDTQFTILPYSGVFSQVALVLKFPLTQHYPPPPPANC